MPMRPTITVSILVAMLLGAAFAQSTTTAPKDASEARLGLIRQYLTAIRQEKPVPFMPGAEPSLEAQLVPVLAQELLSEHEEIMSLKRQIDELKGKKPMNR